MRWVVAAFVVTGIVAFFAFDLGRYLNLEYLRAQHAGLVAHYVAQPVLTIGLFFLAYVAVAGLSLPGAVVMTLIAGAIFGLGWGTVVVSLASTIGAGIAFFAARFALRDWVQERLGSHLGAFNAGVAKDGGFYLFALRLVPVVPFFVINLVMGLTPMRLATFAWVSQLGMLPGTLVFVNAGTQLAKIDGLSGIFSPGLIASFCLLGVFPMIAKHALGWLNRRRALKGYEKPARFDRDLIVIGAGSAGLVSALIGVTVKAKVTLIERDRMGGDCLNTGCVPSKALIRSARFVAQMKHSADVGIREATASFEFADIMARVQSVIRTIEPNDSVERYEGLGVECIAGEATVVSPYAVEVNGQTLTARGIIVATGARPAVPPIPGLDAVPYVTSDTVWELKELPKRMVVLGGGPIGCELTQSFARLGTQVTQVEMLPRLLPNEDADISERVAARFADEGIEVLTGHKALEFTADRRLLCQPVDVDGAPSRSVEFDVALIALGRRANAQTLGLQALGVEFNPNGTIVTDAALQTYVPTIFACGDVVGPLQFTHVASHQAWYATVNALFGSLKRFSADYSAIPHATFTEPEVARVGLNEREANEQGIAYEVTRFPFDELDRAVADAHTDGEIKVLTVPGKDRILGATIVGENAGDLIAEYALAMRHRLGLNKILATVHAYPTMMEGNKMLAGRWRKAHAPERVLAIMSRYHAWRRGAN
ncbi:MAG: pyruvate/2-oxoglutarate dehydrogenase complex dihydrolipoamide dehydrogenase (E3) component [Gammaproteobacteria bacterium]|jgi:pyruvate/2-oxoglutarate dehydrogenase complex dihydrolipoamide dehydrogenase (E3) component/uncharacterized membrane protein YdjX (TVP38/TMEM64 family)